MQELANAVGGHLSGQAVVVQNIDQLTARFHGQRGTKNHCGNSVSKGAADGRHEGQALVWRENEPSILLIDDTFYQSNLALNIVLSRRSIPVNPKSGFSRCARGSFVLRLP